MMVECYWAEIHLDSDRKIIFYTENKIPMETYLDILQMQKNYKVFEMPVSLNEEDIFKLKTAGISVLNKNFHALDEKWHCFSGYWNEDAFQLSSDFLSDLLEEGSITVTL